MFTSTITLIGLVMTEQESLSPWVTDSTELWEGDKCAKDLPNKRVKRWGFSGWELLKDPIGRDHFHTFLEREYATENLLFVEAVWNMKKMAEKDVAAECHLIWNRFMGPQAEIPINVDSKSFKITEENMENPDRYLRSSHYKDFLESTRKKNGKSFTIGKLSTAKINIASAKEQLKVNLTGNSFQI